MDNIYLKDKNLVKDYKELTEKYLEICSANKKYKEENDRLKNILNSMKEAMEKQEESNNNIKRIISQLKNQYREILSKIELNSVHKPVPILKEQDLVTSSNHFSLLSTTQTNEILSKKISELENEYNLLLNIFNHLIAKYKILHEDFKNISIINKQLVEVNEQKRPNQTDTAKINTIIDHFTLNNFCEPTPSFIKFLSCEQKI